MSMIVLSDQYHEVLSSVFCDGRRCERVVGGVDGPLSGLAYKQCMLAYHYFQLHQIARMLKHGYKSLMKWLQVIDEVTRLTKWSQVCSWKCHHRIVC